MYVSILSRSFSSPSSFLVDHSGPRILCNDCSSWNAYYFDLWPFCGANRVPDIIIPYSLIIFPAARQAARQHKSLLPALCWQVSAFPDYYRRYFWLPIARATSSCVLQLKSDGPQVEQGDSVAAVSFPGTNQHQEQMIYRTVNNNRLYSTPLVAGSSEVINWHTHSKIPNISFLSVWFCKY